MEMNCNVPGSRVTRFHVRCFQGLVLASGCETKVEPRTIEPGTGNQEPWNLLFTATVHRRAAAADPLADAWLGRSRDSRGRCRDCRRTPRESVGKRRTAA